MRQKFHFNSPPPVSKLIELKDLFLSNIDIRGRTNVPKITMKWTYAYMNENRKQNTIKNEKDSIRFVKLFFPGL